LLMNRGTPFVTDVSERRSPVMLRLRLQDQATRG
jgi:hypothetical protein